MKNDPDLHLDDLTRRFTSGGSRKPRQEVARPKRRMTPRTRGIILGLALIGIIVLILGLMVFEKA